MKAISSTAKTSEVPSAQAICSVRKYGLASIRAVAK